MPSYRDQDQRSANLLLLVAAGMGLFYAARSAVRASRKFDFRGKTVLIAGGSRGFGLLLAREFAKEGASLALCTRDADELLRARRELVERGAEVLVIPCDISDKDQVKRMVDEVYRGFGSVDVLVNNAGIISVGPLEVMNPEDYEQAMKNNFWGAVYTTLAVLPRMRQRARSSESARIVNISSIGGKVPAPHLLPYTASKFALTGFSEGLRAELAKDNILVTTICPGLMRTGSPRNADFKGRHRAEYAWFAIADSLPLTSMDASRAARKIVNACRYGVGEVTLSVQAKAAVTFHALFPSLSAQLNGLLNRWLPEPGGVGEQKAKGKDSESAWAPSVLTVLGERAAQENNELK